jgi:hypothetical protein
MASLIALPSIDSIELQVESVPLDVNPASGLEINPRVIDQPFFLGDGGVWSLTEGSARLVEGTGAAGAWDSLAVDHSLARMAGFGADGLMVIDKAGEEPLTVEMPECPGPTAAGPAFDRLGWLWAACGDVVVAFNADGEPVKLGSTWLTGRQVLALAPSRDGARLALAVEGEKDQAELIISGVVRGDGAAPWRLTSPLKAGTAIQPVTSLTWSDEVSLAFLAPAGPGEDATGSILTIGGDVTFLKPPTDPPNSLAAGLGTTQVYASGRAGGLFVYSPRGRTWASLASGARAVTLAP